MTKIISNLCNEEENKILKGDTFFYDNFFDEILS